jgi:hypothetical protein
MGTFAETAIIDYRLSFADLGNQTSVFRFHLEKANESLQLLPFSIFSKQTEAAVFCYFSSPFAVGCPQQ